MRQIEELIKQEREQINKCDLDILDILVKRARSVQKIGQLKEQNTSQVYRPEREIIVKRF